MRSHNSVFCVLALAILGSTIVPCARAAEVDRNGQSWIGTWGAAPQRGISGRVQTFGNQTLRLIVHTSAGGKRVRIKLSNIFGDQPLLIGSAHIARRATGADIDPSSDRRLTFHGRPSIRIAARSEVKSDPVDLDVAALSDLTVSLFFPSPTAATTTHILALQTNYVSPETGDSTAATNFTVARTIVAWPFLTGVDVATSSRGSTVVAFGSSTTDGDGSTRDTNRRWPDVLAERLQKAGDADMGVLNEGIIGNRLLSDSQSPRQTGGPLAATFEQLGPALGTAGVARFERDVLRQAGVKYVVLVLGINDLLFPGSFISDRESVSAQAVIAGNRQLIARAHKKHIRALGTTVPPFENALFRSPFFDGFYTPEKEKTRQEVNDWVRRSGEFDGVIDLDEVVRDPSHPTQLLPAYDSGDHLHVNDAGNIAQGNSIPLALFHGR